MAEITKSTTYYLESLVTDQQGDGVTGLTVTYKVIRSSDNTVLASGTLSDIGDGVYKGSYLFSVVGQFRVLYFTPTNYLDAIETVNVSDATTVAISDKIDRILGLSMENYRLFDSLWDKSNNMTFTRIRLYPTPEDVDTDTNAFAEYEVRSAYGKGKYRNNVVDYRVKKVA